MAIENALASVAVKDLEAAIDWYERVLGRPGSRPMPEIAEWRFPRGGCLQVYHQPERAGNGSFTLAVDDIEGIERRLAAVGIDTGQRSSNDRVDTFMVMDPDGNHVAFAQAHDPALAR